MKYKLIKEYPGSPRLGNTIDNLENDWIENYPEFWQEVVEKDYEILEVKGKYGAISSYIEELDNDLKDKTIFKIKRLSDGKEEIFTIGDKTNNGTISKFEIDSNGVRVFFEEKPKNYHVSLNSIKHVKQPLFTTEDGVDIFEGDEVVCFDKEDWITRNEKYKFQPFDVKDKNYLFFSTKEKAEEYILMNKPVLSLTDLKNLGIFNETDYCKRMWITIKELVKQKLKS